MRTIFPANRRRVCYGISRREYIKTGILGIGTLSVANLLRLKALGAVDPKTSFKAVIYVYLFGGPSHIDIYDMKPDAPAEYRGEFKPIQTNVPGFDICEHMPLQAKIADKLALIRNMKFKPFFHDPGELFTGFTNRAPKVSSGRPDFGSVVSRLQSGAGPRDLPAYVALDRTAGYEFGNGPAYLGMTHKAFVPGTKLETLALPRDITLERLQDREALRCGLDRARRTMDQARAEEVSGMDAFRAQALKMITGHRACEAFDVSREPDRVRARYGGGQATRLLQARRLVEAGVPVVTLTYGDPYSGGNVGDCNDSWDTHERNFKCLKQRLPKFDQAVYALITDLHERGLDKDVLVVIGGEMGRTPKIGGLRGGQGNTKPDGRDHWGAAGFSLIAGGGLRMGQVIGKTDARAERAVGKPYTPQNVLATIYHALGINPASTLPDPSGRPIPLLDDCDMVKELI